MGFCKKVEQNYMNRDSNFCLEITNRVAKDSQDHMHKFCISALMCRINTSCTFILIDHNWDD